MLSRDRMNQRMKEMAIERDKMRTARLAEMTPRTGRAAKLRQAPRASCSRSSISSICATKFDNEELREQAEDGRPARPGAARRLHVLPRRAPIDRVPRRAVLLFVVVRQSAYPPIIKVMMALGAGFLGFYLPNMFISEPRAEAPESIKQAFPDALDMLLICVQSGMSVEAAFGKVSQGSRGASRSSSPRK